MEKNSFTLVNRESGELAFKISRSEQSNTFDHITRYNYYCLIWVKEGRGIFKSDFSEYSFSPGDMLFFTPYQPFMLMPDGVLEMDALYWHYDFFCIEKHKKEVACNGVLFNNVYQSPSISVPQHEAKLFESLFESIFNEIQSPAMAQHDALTSYLKIFLINASRLKMAQSSYVAHELTQEPFSLLRLKEMIEQHFRQKHTASDYADMLNVPTRTLTRLTKNHFSKTITELIQERIIIEAKRELYLTDSPVKAIAYDLGFEDEYYFSRLFKKVTNVSPQMYRDTVGFNRLNMSA